ncbi:hypothetical protein PR202_gb23087 [Eleusine coracana subsp. coracana]|uniref:Uncharacterized protein n=1 Tax=Eleusine coracana subsp. coracana TaxID=191504 RepID=A0AAV5FHZ0_ELECO|nr:hypothetical protein PR202_gb23087 [Eleusine coracana subsp. coracana]
MSVKDLFNFVIDQNIADGYLEKVQQEILENRDRLANDDEISPTAGAVAVEEGSHLLDEDVDASPELGRLLHARVRSVLPQVVHRLSACVENSPPATAACLESLVAYALGVATTAGASGKVQRAGSSAVSSTRRRPTALPRLPTRLFGHVDHRSQGGDVAGTQLPDHDRAARVGCASEDVVEDCKKTLR